MSVRLEISLVGNEVAELHNDHEDAEAFSEAPPRCGG